jgi:hypothetical protein
MVEPAAAILLFQVAQSRNFIHDDLIPSLSAALTSQGVHNELFEATLPASDAPDADDLSAIDALVAQLQGRYRVCAYVRLWSEAVFQRLRTQLPDVTWIYLGDPRVAFPGTTHAFPLNQVDTFAAIARAVAAGEPVTEAMFRLPQMELTRAHARDNLVRIGVGRDQRPDRPAVVHGSAGCAYGQSVRDNPHFRDVPFPDEKVVLRGCSFCASGGIPRRPSGEVLASMLAQLDHLLDHAPETARIQLNDQNPFPYLVQFIDRLGERAAHPMEVLIETRADWFLGSMPVMERARQGAERHGHRVLLFLVGLESLSQKDLDLYNKGVTVEQNERTRARVSAPPPALPEELLGPPRGLRVHPLQPLDRALGHHPQPRHRGAHRAAGVSRSAHPRQAPALPRHRALLQSEARGPPLAPLPL